MLLRRFFLSVTMTAFIALPAHAAVYDIGPGQPYTSLGAFAFEDLEAGDTVNIHYRAEPYFEKIRIRAQGTPESPVIIRGIPGPEGQRPVLDGTDATTRSADTYSYEPLQDLGLIIVYRGDGDPYGYKPKHLVIEGLELRNGGEEGGTFTDANGAERQWSENASAIWALAIENFTLRNCRIHDCGNGLFINSRGDEETQSRNILIERNEIFDNSVPGRYFEHNIYTEAQNITFQYNYLGPVKAGALGGNLKDRSARTIVRYNWIQGGQRLIDLVESQDSFPFTGTLPEYGDDYVYGNILVTNPGDANALVHYGGDSGGPETFRQGTLHFYHNTVRVLRDQSESYRTHIFDLSSNEQTVDARNNIIYVDSFTPGQPATNLQLLINSGIANLGVNWISPGWQPWTDNGTTIVGTITGTSNVIGGPANDPGFLNLAANDLRLAEDSACLDISGALDTPSAANFPVQNEYKIPRDSQPRTVVGAAADLGAFELGADSGGEGEGEGEGAVEGEGTFEGEGEGEGQSPLTHSADQSDDNVINLTELLRVIQLYNLAGFGCAPGSEDGFEPEATDQTCSPHASDYNPQDWAISLTELLRVIQFYNAGGYSYCPGGSEDEFCLGSV